jgi:hypothetical protein
MDTHFRLNCSLNYAKQAVYIDLAAEMTGFRCFRQKHTWFKRGLTPKSDKARTGSTHFQARDRTPANNGRAALNPTTTGLFLAHTACTAPLGPLHGVPEFPINTTLLLYT